MSVKYAVLGLLAQRRGYGYELVQRFGAQIGPAWRLNPGTIYIALDKLEQEGLVRPVPAADGRPPTRRRTVRGGPRVVYEPTPRGLVRFDEWMAACSPTAPLREELHLKLALSRPCNLPRLLELAEEQERGCLERLSARLGERAIDDVLESAPSWSAVASAIVREAEVAHLRATVEWLRLVREAIGRMQARTALPAER